MPLGPRMVTMDMSGSLVLVLLAVQVRDNHHEVRFTMPMPGTMTFPLSSSWAPGTPLHSRMCYIKIIGIVIWTSWRFSQTYMTENANATDKMSMVTILGPGTTFAYNNYTV